MRNKIKISDNQMKNIIAESVKKVLNEAAISRGTSFNAGFGDNDYPYDSDIALMMANRFEKALGKQYTVECHIDSHNVNYHYGEYEKHKDDPTYYKPGMNYTLIFDVYCLFYKDINLILNAINKAKLMFGTNVRVIYFNQVDNHLMLDLDVTDKIGKEPKRGNLPKRPWTWQKSLSNTNFGEPRPYERFEEPNDSLWTPTDDA